METSTTVLTDYWAQISLLLLGCGYLIKTIINSINKKKEINHSLFTQCKLDAVKRYLDAYSETVLLFKNLPLYDFFEHKISTTDIDNIIHPPLDNLKRATNAIQLYFEESTFAKFNDITENIFSINSKLSNIYFNYSEEYTTTQKSNDFWEVKINKLNENENLIANVLKEIRNNM